MKKLFTALAALMLLAVPSFAQTQVTQTRPQSFPYGPLISVAAAGGTNVQSQFCTVPLAPFGFNTHRVVYMFPTGAPGAATITVSGSTNGTTFSTLDTGTTTTGDVISVTGTYTAICVTATTMTGAGVTVSGVYQGSLGSTGGSSGDVNIAEIGGNSVSTTIPISGTATVVQGTATSLKTQANTYDGSGNAITSTSSALDVNIKSGIAPGTTDTDDGSIANGQSGPISLAENMVYDGSVWRRLTIGSAGSASSQVVTVQGVASMTPVLVNPGTAANFGVGATGSAVPANGVYIMGNTGGTARGLTGTSVSSSYALDVNIVAGAGSGGTALADGGTFTAGSTSDTPVAGLYEASPSTCPSGKACAFGMTTNRELKVSISALTTDSADNTAFTENPVGIGGEYIASPSDHTDGDKAVLLTDIKGRLVTVTIPNTAGGWDSVNATAADGATACTSTVQAVKASAGVFGGYYIANPNTSDIWLHVYNTASGSVTVGTTNPKLTFRIPGFADGTGGANLELAQGVSFGTAMSIACTTSAGGTGNPSTAVEADIFYK